MATDNGFRNDVSDFERMGGGPAVRTVVDRCYQLVLADEDLAVFFEGADMAELKRDLAVLISQVLGGPADHGRDLRRGYAGLAMARDDYLKVMSYLVQTMVEVRVEPAIIGRVGDALAATKQDVVTAGPR